MECRSKRGILVADGSESFAFDFYDACKNKARTDKISGVDHKELGEDVFLDNQ